MLAFADWGVEKWILFFVPIGLIAIVALVVFLMRHTLRTRLRMVRQLHDDPKIDDSDWLVVFDWTRKILYVPTIVASLVAAALTAGFDWGFLPAAHADAAGRIIGGAWLVIFAVNFLVDEYEVSVKVLAIVILTLLLTCLWLYVLGWLRPVLAALGHVTVQMNATLYLVVGLLFLLATVISWVRGLFYFAAFTPNFLNIQGGPTETGEQVSREDYSTRLDTSDLLERMLGFGRIIVTFRDSRRLPVSLLVGRIGRKAQRLEAIRGKVAVDIRQSGGGERESVA